MQYAQNAQNHHEQRLYQHLNREEVKPLDNAEILRRRLKRTSNRFRKQAFVTLPMYYSITDKVAIRECVIVFLIAVD